MCTVSVIRPWPSDAERPLVRLVGNRDERRDRAAANPPAVVDAGGTRAVMPVDPAGGGTWIAANDAGLIFTLLNGRESDQVDTAEPIAATAPSRGGIITRLVSAVTLDAVAERLLSFDWTAYRSWRLLVVGGGRLIEAGPNLGGRRLLVRPLPSRFMATSSSRHEALATRARGRLFRRMMPQADPGRQDAFQAHQWPERPELSVVMARPEARTVSRTTVEVGRTRVRMIYRLVGEAQAPSVTVELDLMTRASDVA